MYVSNDVACNHLRDVVLYCRLRACGVCVIHALRFSDCVVVGCILWESVTTENISKFTFLRPFLTRKFFQEILGLEG